MGIHMSRTSRARCPRRGLLFLTGSLAVSIAAAAEPAGDEAGRLEEIVVTAQKREQNQQDVGTSITAFDANALARLGIKDVTELAGQVPGLQYNQFGSTVTVFNLRGVSQNDFSDHQEAPIAAYSDDAYIAMLGVLAGSMYDLQRVEVLRGPQGTLFGRNATGGLIHYISNKPTDTPTGYFQVTGGNFGTIQSEGAVSGPLTDRISARLSESTSDHNGYISNRIGHAIEDQHQYASRLQVQLRASDTADILIKLHGLTNNNETGGIYSWAASQPDSTGRGYFVAPNYTGNCPQVNGGCTPGADDSGYRNPSSDVFNQAENRRGIFNRTVWGGTVHVNWRLPQFTVTSVTDYLQMQKRYGEDTDLSPNSTLIYDTLQHYHQISQELRLAGTTRALTWIAGAYYLDYRTTDFIGVIAIPPFGGTSFGNFVLTDRTAAAFGQLEYAMTDRLTAIAGARYTHDAKAFDYTFEPQDLHYNSSAYPSAKQGFNLPTGKVELDYKADPGLLLYGSVNRGAKGGGWSAPNSGVVDPNLLPYREEKLTSYELGIKSTFWGGAARLNISSFYYDYKDYQGFFLVGLSSYVRNLNAQVKGGEAEFAVVPVKGLNLQLGVSNLNSRVPAVPTPAGNVVEAQLPQAPKWSINALARYEWHMADGTASIESDAKWNSAQYLELVNAPVDLQSSYAVVNARIGYMTGNGAWEASMFVKNLANRIYRQYNLDLSSVGWNMGVYAPPRLFGASITYHWDPR
jgi:iron complex outermembrane recepter protein